MFPRKRVYGLWFMVKSIFLAFLILIALLSTIYYLPSTIKADEVDDLQQQINALNKAREQSVAATKPLVGQLDSLKRQLAQIQASLLALSAKITQKEKDLDLRKQKLVQLLAVF